MPDPGVAPTPAVPDGQQELLRLQGAGFHADEIAAYKTQQTQRLLQGGFKADEVDKYWGDGPLVSPIVTRAVAPVVGTIKPASGYVPSGDFMTDLMGETGQLLDKAVHQSLADMAFGPGGSMKMGLDIAAALIAGPATALYESGEANRHETRAQQEGAGAMAATVFPQPEIGAEAAVAAAGDRLAGIEAHAVAQVSAEARTASMEAYRAGELPDPSRLPEALTHPSAIPPDLAAAIPKAEDYAQAAARMLPPKAGQGEAMARIQRNMQQIYQRTGLGPEEQVALLKTHPEIRDELLGQDSMGEPSHPTLSRAAPDEPPPAYKMTDKPPAPPKTPPTEPRPAVNPTSIASPEEAQELLAKLEGSKDWSISPAGAVGHYQIMVPTARQYDPALRALTDAEVQQKLLNPGYNKQIATQIVGDLYRRYNGNMDAIAIAYNAGPGRANHYLMAGPGTRLEAVVDGRVRGGIEYIQVAANRDESFLPYETQKYLANGRRRMGGQLSEGEGGEMQLVSPHQRPDGKAVPSFDKDAAPESADELELTNEVPGEKLRSGSIGAGSIWDNATVEDAQKEVLSNIGEQPAKDWMRGNTPDDWADRLFAINPARRLDTELVRQKLLDRDEEPGIEDAFRQTFASANRADLWITTGALDGPKDKNFVEGSHNLLEVPKMIKASGGDPDGFRAYLMSDRTMTKGAQISKEHPTGISTGVNPFAAKIIAENAGERAKYEEAAKVWTGVFNSSLDYARKSGRYSAAQVKAMKELNPVWVSFRRIMGDDESFRTTSGYGFTMGNPLRKMEGSDRQIVDPLISSVDNLRLTIATADQNWARGQVVTLAEKDPRVAAMLGLKKETGIHDPNDNGAFVDKILEPYRDQMTSEEYEKARTAMEPLIAARGDAGLSKNQFSYFRDGQREVWTVASPEFARMMQGSTTRQQANIVTRIFQSVAALDRAGVTISPAFVERNIISHQIIQFINDPGHPPPFVAPIAGVIDALGGGKLWREAQAKGAFGAALSDIDRDYLARDMNKLFNETGATGKIWNVLTSPLEAARWLQERGDAANRVGLYARGIRAGLDPQKAAMAARKAGIDYGELLAPGLKWWARTTPFFKAKLLYINQAAEAFTSRPVESTAYALGAITLPSVILWALRRAQDPSLPEDRRSDQIPRWQHDYGAVTPEMWGQRVIIRYPEASGLVFGAMVNRMLDGLVAHDPAAATDFAHAVLAQFPIEGPAALQSPAENAFNYNLMTGQPMIPGSMTQASTDMKYTENTSMVARKLSRYLSPLTDNTPLKAQFSPIALDHISSGWAGGAGQAVMHIVGAPLHIPGPPMDAWDNPFTHSLVMRNPGFNAQAVADFYDEKAKFDAAATDVSLQKRATAAGDVDTQAQVQREYVLKQADAKLNTDAHALNVMRASIWGIYRDKTMSDDEKRQHIESAYVQAIQLAKGRTEEMRQILAAQ